MSAHVFIEFIKQVTEKKIKCSACFRNQLKNSIRHEHE